MQYGAAVIAGDLRSMELTEPTAAAAAVYDQPIGLRLLYAEPDGGEEHYLVRYPPGRVAAGQPRPVSACAGTPRSSRCRRCRSKIINRRSRRGLRGAWDSVPGW